MAIRPVFVIKKARPYFGEIETEFQFFSGFSDVQKQKSITSLHDAYLSLHPDGKPLEISTKSPNPIGQALSAFNLKILLQSGIDASLESVFQASKIFEYGGPYTDILSKLPWEAKKDTRLKESGNIISFNLEGKVFPTEPKTFFYDWLYVNAVDRNAYLKEEILK